MLDIIKILNDKFVESLAEGFRSVYGGSYSDYGNLIAENAEMAIQTIASSNALYHNAEHTIQVTLVGQAILQGKVIVDGSLPPEVWLNFIMSLLCHDIGYVPGICSTDTPDKALVQGSDAMLMSVHIDRGKQFAEEAFSQQKGIDIHFIQDCMERTRFPVPEAESYQCGSDLPGLVRGADLVGQLSDPRYINKLPAVFFEFEESGYNEVTGYKKPGDLFRYYENFYEKSVVPYVKETLEYLSATSEGKKIISSYEANIEMIKVSSRRI